MNGVQAVPQELVPNRLGEQIGAVPVPQTKEDVVEMTAEQIGGVPPLTLDQPGDQACRDSADAAHRQGCRYDCCDAATGPFTGDQPGDQAC